MSEKLKEFTWQEVAEHNNEKSCWLYIDRNVYDVTSFLSRHPGGKDMILLMAGRDCTDLFIAYHPFTDKPKEVLKKFQIGVLKGNTEFGRYKADSGFYKTVRQRVGKYFADNKLDYKSPYSSLLRLLISGGLMFLCWYLAMTCRDELSFRYRMYLCIVAGVFQALNLLHTMHDCSHTALSHWPNAWRYVGILTMDLFSACSFEAWLHQHTVGHHVYTNVLSVDPDCPMEASGDIRRILPHQQWSTRYFFQWIYLPILYCAYAFKYRIQDITQFWCLHMNGNIRVNPRFRGTESFVLQLLGKVIWLWRCVYVPLFVWNNRFWDEFLPLFLTIELVSGYYLTWNFQVSHVTTGMEWPLPVRDPKTGELMISMEWAKAQVETSMDYSHGSFLMTYLSGALNYQTIHHLFPCVSQYYYPDIAHIVKDTCKEFDIKFNHVQSFRDAFVMHLKQLYDMSLNPHKYH